MLFRLPSKTLSWLLYDFSNSAYVLLGMTLFLPLFYTSHIHTVNNASQQWGLLISLSLFIVAISAPFIGALADKNKNRFRLFLALNLIFISSVLAIAMAESIPSIGYEVLIVTATSSFSLCLFLYDSLMPGYFKKIDSVSQSAKGWAFGYFGGFACLLIALSILGFRMPASATDYQIILRVIIVFYIAFSLPLLIRMFEEAPGDQNEISLMNDVRKTLSDIIKNKQILLYLICALALMDGLTTLTFFISIYAKSVLGFETRHIVMLIVFLQCVAVPGTLFISRIAERVGEPTVLLWLALLWIFVTVLVYITDSLYTFYLVALLAGTLLGSTPAILRGWYARLVPKDARSRYFGFNAMATRVAAVFGPLAYVLTASILNERVAILSVVPLFALAMSCLLIYRIKFSETS